MYRHVTQFESRQQRLALQPAALEAARRLSLRPRLARA